ncbi:sigma 54-interacting transcriptional regulator [bacterium]|nr:sigma 54-interacting transcriptional regulator [bacterium]
MSSNVPFQGFDIRDPAMIQVYEEIRDYAYHDQPCLFLGPSGCGKEFAARFYYKIWIESGHGGGPFNSVNCSMLTEQFAHSELFGHVAGAFTGASFSKPGLFEASNHGVLFLDEIGEMPLLSQSMLLRAIDPETHTARRLGGSWEYSTEYVRVISATDRSPESLRFALLNRLGMRITIPGLDQRPGDRDSAVVFFAIRAFIKRKDRDKLYQAFFNKAWPAQTKDADMENDPDIAALAGAAGSRIVPLVARLSWPGNFRTLRIAVETAMLRARFTEKISDFEEDMLRFFAAHATRYGEGKLADLVRVFVSGAEADLGNPLLLRLQSAVPGMEEEETRAWARFLISRGEDVFSRMDAEKYFDVPPARRRTLQARLAAFVDAGILDRGGAKGGEYRSAMAADTMVVRKKRHPDLFPLPQQAAEARLHPGDLEALLSMIENGKRVFISERPGGDAGLAVALGRRLEQKRAVYYFRLDEKGLQRFFELLVMKLTAAGEIGDSLKKQMEQLPPDALALMLTGFVNRLFGDDEDPVIILDAVQYLVGAESNRAMENMVRCWSIGGWILAGVKLDNAYEELGFSEFAVAAGV